MKVPNWAVCQATASEMSIKYLTISIPSYTTDPTYHSMVPYKTLLRLFNTMLVSETRFCGKLHPFSDKFVSTQEMNSLNHIFSRMPQCQEVSCHSICLCLVVMHFGLLTADKPARCNILIQDTCVFCYSIQDTMAQQLFQSRRTKDMLLCCLRTCGILLPPEPILERILFTIISTYDEEHPIFHCLFTLSATWIFHLLHDHNSRRFLRPRCVQCQTEYVTTIPSNSSNWNQHLKIFKYETFKYFQLFPSQLRRVYSFPHEKSLDYLSL